MVYATAPLFGSPSPGAGPKRSNIIKSELQSQFQRFLNQTLCIFSQMKDIYFLFFFLFDLLRPLNNLSVMRDRSSWVEPVLS